MQNCRLKYIQKSYELDCHQYAKYITICIIMRKYVCNFSVLRAFPVDME